MFTSTPRRWLCLSLDLPLAHGQASSELAITVENTIDESLTSTCLFMNTPKNLPRDLNQRAQAINTENP